MQKLKSIAQSLRSSLEINRPIIILSVIISLLSGVLFILQTTNVWVTESLQLSPANPWGVFTSMFLHSSWDHLTANIVMLWIWTAFIVLMDSLLSEAQKKSRALFFVATVVVSAIVVDIVWAAAFTAVNPGVEYTSVGASGLVYAFSGGALGFAITNLMDALPKLKGEEKLSKRSKGVVFGNSVFIAMLLSIMLYSPDIFLSKAHGSNVFVHALTFVFGMAAIMGRAYVMPLAQRRKIETYR